MLRPFKLTIENEDSGEIREFRLARVHMLYIWRALRRYSDAPKFLAERFRP